RLRLRPRTRAEEGLLGHPDRRALLRDRPVDRGWHAASEAPEDGEAGGARDGRGVADPAGVTTLLHEGRASEILDLGDGRVFRRFKTGGDPEREAATMALAAQHGYPVPRVDEVRADGLV